MLVGKKVSTCSFPKSIKMSKENNNGTLIVGVERGNEIDIEYSKAEIISQINSYFGYKLINEIRLQTFNVIDKKNKKKNIIKGEIKKFEDKINTIKNKGIRDSLSDLLNIAKK